jgi:hypothetical protein
MGVCQLKKVEMDDIWTPSRCQTHFVVWQRYRRARLLKFKYVGVWFTSIHKNVLARHYCSISFNS